MVNINCQDKLSAASTSIRCIVPSTVDRHTPYVLKVLLKLKSFSFKVCHQTSLFLESMPVPQDNSNIHICKLQRAYPGSLYLPSVMSRRVCLVLFWCWKDIIIHNNLLHNLCHGGISKINRKSASWETISTGRVCRSGMVNILFALSIYKYWMQSRSLYSEYSWQLTLWFISGWINGSSPSHTVCQFILDNRCGVFTANQLI